MNITVYSLPNCVQCDQTKRLLEKNNLEYTEIDLSTNKEAAEYVLSLGYKSAPVVFANDDHWSGFRIEKIKALAVSHPQV